MGTTFSRERELIPVLVKVHQEYSRRNVSENCPDIYRVLYDAPL